MAAPTVFVVNGPNLDHLGERGPAIYGSDTLADVERACADACHEAGLTLRSHQTNAEHEMIGWIHEARIGAAGIVINPAALSYAGYPILDALKMCDCPIIEVHISNIHRREADWRSQSIMTQAAAAIMSGLGTHGYPLAIPHVAHLHAKRSS